MTAYSLVNNLAKINKKLSFAERRVRSQAMK